MVVFTPVSSSGALLQLGGHHSLGVTAASLGDPPLHLPCTFHVFRTASGVEITRASFNSAEMKVRDGFLGCPGGFKEEIKASSSEGSLESQDKAARQAPWEQQQPSPAPGEMN